MDDEEERPAAAFLDDLQIGEAAEEPYEADDFGV
jgi:hypothetical protein